MKKALLAIETATDVCSVALHDAGGIVAVFSLTRKQQHARALAPLIETAITWLGGGWDALGAVAVSAGPGSYTGLRIGLSTAKGLCAARDLDLVAVSTLEALAHVALPAVLDDGLLGAVLPSRRGEVYLQWFRRHQDALVAGGPAAPLALGDALRADFPGGSAPVLVGSGGALLATALLPRISVTVLSPEVFMPDAAVVARLGYARWLRGETESVAHFEPDYLKPFALNTAPAPA